MHSEPGLRMIFHLQDHVGRGKGRRRGYIRILQVPGSLCEARDPSIPELKLSAQPTRAVKHFSKEVAAGERGVPLPVFVSVGG